MWVHARLCALQIVGLHQRSACTCAQQQQALTSNKDYATADHLCGPPLKKANTYPPDSPCKLCLLHQTSHQFYFRECRLVFFFSRNATDSGERTQLVLKGSAVSERMSIYRSSRHLGNLVLQGVTQNIMQDIGGSQNLVFSLLAVAQLGGDDISEAHKPSGVVPNYRFLAQALSDCRGGRSSTEEESAVQTLSPTVVDVFAFEERLLSAMTMSITHKRKQRDFFDLEQYVSDGMPLADVTSGSYRRHRNNY